ENQLGGGIQVPLSDQAVIQFGAVWQRLESTGVESGHDDNLLLNISFQYHLPSRAKREAKRPIFNENLQKEF
ncbi:MAG: hypothetical protein KC931_07800, partial [Candidatus Omnitrophica bacterium]|nr:hypothetical protein [Candidatus Omnitrophota bacterium]